MEKERFRPSESEIRTENGRSTTIPAASRMAHLLTTRPAGVSAFRERPVFLTFSGRFCPFRRPDVLLPVQTSRRRKTAYFPNVRTDAGKERPGKSTPAGSDPRRNRKKQFVFSCCQFSLPAVFSGPEYTLSGTRSSTAAPATRPDSTFPGNRKDGRFLCACPHTTDRPKEGVPLTLRKCLHYTMNPLKTKCFTLFQF